jgi:hypothetical protein
MKLQVLRRQKVRTEKGSEFKFEDFLKGNYEKQSEEIKQKYKTPYRFLLAYKDILEKYWVQLKPIMEIRIGKLEEIRMLEKDIEFDLVEVNALNDEILLMKDILNDVQPNPELLIGGRVYTGKEKIQERLDRHYIELEHFDNQLKTKREKIEAIKKELGGE